MIAPMTPEADIEIERTIEIAAPANVAFQAILDQIGPASEMPDGTPFPMKIEAWPGGRWYRDLGDNAGHFWGHVQVIKPPKLLEIRGPLFMSYPALNFLQYRLTAEGDRTVLKLTHQAIGLIPQDHREGVVEGWDYELQKIRESAERRANEARSR